VTLQNPINNPACRIQYQAVLDERQKQFNLHFSDAELSALHQDAHARLLDIERTFFLISKRREYKMFELAFQLLGDGLCHLASANYKVAFYCLRSFLEMSCAAVRFSAFEYELRQWEVGNRDVSWSVISGDETGCFSKNFAAAFLPALKEETKHYASLAQRTYRECSEYVHGNPSSHDELNGIQIERAKHWFELFSTAYTSVMFCLFVRYLSDYHEELIGDAELNAIVIAEIGHFSSIRELLSGEA
jgi:hypothetical protein